MLSRDSCLSWILQQTRTESRDQKFLLTREPDSRRCLRQRAHVHRATASRLHSNERPTWGESVSTPMSLDQKFPRMPPPAAHRCCHHRQSGLCHPTSERSWLSIACRERDLSASTN